MKIETLKIGEATLTAYIQKNAPEIKNADRRPAVLILPGGGYEFVSNPENEPVALEYSAKGFQAFTLEYSVKEKGVFPVPETEVLRATAVVRARAEEWFVDKEKIALGRLFGGRTPCGERGRALEQGIAFARGGRISRRRRSPTPWCLFIPVSRRKNTPIRGSKRYTGEGFPKRKRSF